MKKIAVAGAFVIVVIAALIMLRRDGPRGDLSVSEGPGGAPLFASIDGFRASGHGSADSHKLVFIGLDGATWDILDPMIAAGELPVLARLKGEGAWGVLRSVDCYFTPPAWTSMFSGYLPEHTGIYTFGKWAGKGNVFHSVSSLDVEVPRVWDIASQAGRRVAVTNAPVTYPVAAVNGIMVSGIMTPLSYVDDDIRVRIGIKPMNFPFHDLDRNAYSTRFHASCTLQSNRIEFGFYDTKDDRDTAFDTVVMKVRRSSARDAQAYVFAVGEYSPWFEIEYAKPGEAERPVVCSLRVTLRGGAGLVELTPLFRRPTDPELDLTHPRSLAKEIEEEFGYYLASAGFDADIVLSATEDMTRFARFFYDYDDWDLFLYVFPSPDNIQHVEGFSDRARQVYQTLDRFLGELIAALPEDATLVLASDHGFKHYTYIINLNSLLEQWGLLANLKEIDFARTLVFHDRWCIYFNKQLLTRDQLERRGIPVPDGGSPREALIAFLREKVKNIESPFEDGRTLPLKLVEVPEGSVGSPPDLVLIGGYSDYFVTASDLKIRHPEAVRRARPRSQWYHDRNGMYLLWGPKIRRGYDGGEKNITDIAPTMLYLMDLPMATDFDGEPMLDLVRPGVAAEKTLTYLKDYADLKPDAGISHDELQSLEDKLRTLGYIR